MAVNSCLLLFLLLLLPSLFSPSPSVGINYGQVANNLPTPSAVVPLLRSIGATKVKLYDSNSAVLRAFAGTGVEFVIGLPDSYISKLDKERSAALAWVKSSVLPYLPATQITAVTVGNEVFTGNDTSNMRSLVPAMQNVHSALSSLGLDGKVVVTTAHSLAVLGTSYPPSAGSFRHELAPYISPMLTFLAKTGSPLLINAYPYFAYKADPKGVALEYVLFQHNPGVVDSKTGLRYDNMLHAQVDAVHTAISSLIGEEKARGVEVRVSETGWPSKGDQDEAGATPENAKRYNGNLIRLVGEKKGTPMRPSPPLQVYVFALFNENLKPGPASERNYGLFKPDGTPAYQLGMMPAVNASGHTGGGGSGGEANSTSIGFLSISPAPQAGAGASQFGRGASYLLLAVLGASWILFSAPC